MRHTNTSLAQRELDTIRRLCPVHVPRNVPCPVCAAPIGAPCVRPDGKRPHTLPATTRTHVERRIAAAAAWRLWLAEHTPSVREVRLAHAAQALFAAPSPCLSTTASPCPCCAMRARAMADLSAALTCDVTDPVTPGQRA